MNLNNIWSVFLEKIEMKLKPVHCDLLLDANYVADLAFATHEDANEALSTLYLEAEYYGFVSVYDLYIYMGEAFSLLNYIEYKSKPENYLLGVDDRFIDDGLDITKYGWSVSMLESASIYYDANSKAHILDLPKPMVVSVITFR